MPVWDGLMAGTTVFSSARANPVVARRVQSFAKKKHHFNMSFSKFIKCPLVNYTVFDVGG
jgi:hypothetical protein